MPWILVLLLAAALALAWLTHLIESKNRELETTHLRATIEQQSLREVQVQVSLRKGVVASGNVARISNTSKEIVAITAEVERPSSGARRAFSLTLDPQQTKEIGGLEGWAFVPGDTVLISQPGHKAILVTTQ